MKRYADVVVIVLAIAWCVVGVAMVLFGAGCTVYEAPLQCDRAHPGGGVTVRLAELADDGGERE